MLTYGRDATGNACRQNLDANTDWTDACYEFQAQFEGAARLATGRPSNQPRRTTDDPQTGIRKIPALFAQAESYNGEARSLGTFNSRSAAGKHERALQYFKHH
jgi:hypothetical protein